MDVRRGGVREAPVRGDYLSDVVETTVWRLHEPNMVKKAGGECGRKTTPEIASQPLIDAARLATPREGREDFALDGLIEGLRIDHLSAIGVEGAMNRDVQLGGGRG